MYNSLYLERTGHETTEEVLCHHQQAHLNNRTSVLANSPHHWINIPSGAEYQRNLEEKYPGMRSGRSCSEYDPSFPYERRKPVPQKPKSDLLLYSNTKTFPQLQTKEQKICEKLNKTNNYSRHCNNDDRIRKALKHIDNASKILENY